MGFPGGGMGIQNNNIESVVQSDSKFLSAIFTPTTSGKLYPKGTILGRIAADSKLVPCDQGAADGSEVPMGVTHLSIQSTLTNDMRIDYISSGGVNMGQLSFDDGDPVNELTVDKLRHFNIVPRQVLANDKLDNQ